MTRFLLIAAVAMVATLAWLDREPAEPVPDEAALAQMTARKEDLAARLEKPAMFAVGKATLREALERLARQEQIELKFVNDHDSLDTPVRPFETVVPMPVGSIFEHLLANGIPMLATRDGKLAVDASSETLVGIDGSFRGPMATLVPVGHRTPTVPWGPCLLGVDPEIAEYCSHPPVANRSERALLDTAFAMSLHEVDGPICVEESPAEQRFRALVPQKLKQPVTLDVTGATLKDVLRALSLQLGINLLADGARLNLQQPVTLRLDAVPAERVLTLMFASLTFPSPIRHEIARHAVLLPARDLEQRHGPFRFRAAHRVAIPMAAAIRRVKPLRPLEAFAPPSSPQTPTGTELTLNLERSFVAWRNLSDPVTASEGVLLSGTLWGCEDEVRLYQSFSDSLPFAPSRAPGPARRRWDSLHQILARPAGVDARGIPLEEALARIARQHALNLCFQSVQTPRGYDGRTQVDVDANASLGEQIQRWGPLKTGLEDGVLMISQEAWSPPMELSYYRLRHLMNDDCPLNPGILAAAKALRTHDALVLKRQESEEALLHGTEEGSRRQSFQGTDCALAWGLRGEDDEALGPRGRIAQILQPWSLLDASERPPALLKALASEDATATMLAAEELALYARQAKTEALFAGDFRRRTPRWLWPLAESPAPAILQAMLRHGAASDPTSRQAIPSLWAAARVWPGSERELCIMLCRLLDSPIDAEARMYLAERGSRATEALVDELFDPGSERHDLARQGLRTDFDTDSLASFERLFFDPRPEMNGLAMEILSRTRFSSRIWVSRVERWLKHKDPAIRARTCDLIASLDPSIRRDKKLLGSLAEKDPDLAVRAAAARALKSAPQDESP